MALIIIAIATLALAVATVRWADGEFCRVELASLSASGQVRPVSRPGWVWALHLPYRRLQHAWVWICVAATVGAWASVALDGRRELRRSGTIVVTVAFLAVAWTTAHLLLTGPVSSGAIGICYDLRNSLSFRVPGAILGVWAVTRGRKPDWRGRLVVGMWMSEVGMLVAYGILFG